MNKSTDQRVAVIDILRLIAALGVVMVHAAGAAEMPKYRLPAFTVFGRTIDWVPSPFSFGATGVSLFFVISGYCMYRSLSRRPRPLATYYRDRAARLYPIYAIAVIASAIVAMRLGRPADGADVITKLLFLHGFVQQYNLTINGALWSMATEVQFYLLLPALMIWSRRIGIDRFVVGALVVSLLFRAGAQLFAGHGDAVGGIARDTFIMNMLPGRVAEFAIGMWIAANGDQRTRRFATWLIIPAGVLGIATRAVGPVVIAEPMLGLFYGALLVLALDRAKHFGSVAGPLALLGRSSYAIFLIHLPIASILAKLIPAWPIYERFGTLFVLTLIVSTPVALALHLWVEMPLFERLRPRPGPAASADRITDAGAP